MPKLHDPCQGPLGLKTTHTSFPLLSRSGESPATEAGKSEAIQSRWLLDAWEDPIFGVKEVRHALHCSPLS